MTTCSICLNRVRSERLNPPIRCGHIFHSRCLEEWKGKGKNTCPLCRKVFDVSQFKVVITVQNNYTATSNAVSLNNDLIFNIMDLFDLSFDVEDTLDLDRLLSDLGVSLTDFDSSITDAE